MHLSTKKVIGVALLVILVLYLLNFRLITKKSGSVDVTRGGKTWTVYGSNGCGWTRKQLKSMKDKKLNHTFVDCDKEDCGDISSFPTIKDSDGKTTVGYDANL